MQNKQRGWMPSRGGEETTDRRRREAGRAGVVLEPWKGRRRSGRRRLNEAPDRSVRTNKERDKNVSVCVYLYPARLGLGIRPPPLCKRVIPLRTTGAIVVSAAAAADAAAADAAAADAAFTTALVGGDGGRAKGAQFGGRF
ncbi:hypothetical protein CSUB01_08744 [Colletotrichum sublineola]|uniref:Uncharacterized protein n=1 Tax=Colletotrichum sublineola TaxID=1173701 RepID=A0A066X2H9_COLSU|nr:hypothetical protein CSUB01_08744 [Colletotrichum sublineola]